MAGDAARSRLPEGMFLGAMSGTSTDGVDAALVRLRLEPTDGRRTTVLATAHRPFDAGLRAELLSLNRSGADELHRAALATNRLAEVYATACRAALDAAGVSADQVIAVGAHGQTVRHRPGEFDGLGYTIQLDPGASLAERLGIDVISDFRVRDVAAGGQGAPLVPAFHQQLLAQAPGSGWKAVLNLGGIANLSLLSPDGRLLGFDCGPGNVLLDGWAERHLGRPFDEQGRWASTGRVDDALLARLMATPFLHQPPPKSTGRDLFDTGFVERAVAAIVGRSDGAPTPVDVQATLAEFTARAVSASLAASTHVDGVVERLWVCGGGTRNADLLHRIMLAFPGTKVATTADIGIDPQWMEATAFAWLAACRVGGVAAGRPEVTGARGPRVLGVWHRA